MNLPDAGFETTLSFCEGVKTGRYFIDWEQRGHAPNGLSSNIGMFPFFVRIPFLGSSSLSSIPAFPYRLFYCVVRCIEPPMITFHHRRRRPRRRPRRRRRRRSTEASPKSKWGVTLTMYPVDSSSFPFKSLEVVPSNAKRMLLHGHGNCIHPDFIVSHLSY